MLVRAVQLFEGGEFVVVRVAVSVPRRRRRPISAVRRFHARGGHVVPDARFLQLRVVHRDHRVHRVRAVRESMVLVALGLRVLSVSHIGHLEGVLVRLLGFHATVVVLELVPPRVLSSVGLADASGGLWELGAGVSVVDEGVLVGVVGLLGVQEERAPGAIGVPLGGARRYGDAQGVPERSDDAFQSRHHLEAVIPLLRGVVQGSHWRHFLLVHLLSERAATEPIQLLPQVHLEHLLTKAEDAPFLKRRRQLFLVRASLRQLGDFPPELWVLLHVETHPLTEGDPRVVHRFLYLPLPQRVASRSAARTCLADTSRLGGRRGRRTAPRWRSPAAPARPLWSPPNRTILPRGRRFRVATSVDPRGGSGPAP